MVKDADLFAAAMADVKRLDGRRRLARAAAKAALPPPATKPLPVRRR